MTDSGLAELGADEAGRVQGGAVAPLVAVLLVPLVGAVSTAVDLGYLTTTNQELQSSGDSAALAGASYGAWLVSFYDGSASNVGVSNSCRVRCVR